MDGCMGYQDLKALQDLISPTKDNSDSEDDLPQAGARKLGELNNFKDATVFICSLYFFCVILL